jgi:hypothetical protein
MRSFLPAAALTVLLPAVCAAGVPSPANSTMDPCIVACPAGEIVFHVVVRDISSNPVINSVVAIDFCSCPGVTLCAASTTDPYQRFSACEIRKVTDAAGHADFAIRAGGGCAFLGARVFADGVLLAHRNVASPDQDGNLMVQLADLTLANSKRGSIDPTADFDCDGVVSDSDVSYVVPHGGHVCPPTDPTPARRSTWGEVKTIYR